MCSMEDLSEDDVCSKGDSSRRSNKPLMEKKRRQRINRCLNDLKTLVLEALKKDPSRYSKLEKADILEMTVRHVQSLHRQDPVGVRGRGVGVDERAKYRAGFTQCAVEVTRYLATLGTVVPPDLQAKVIGHLNSVTKTFVSQSPGGMVSSPSGASVVVGGGVVTLGTPSSSPSSAPSSSLASQSSSLVVTTLADSSTGFAGFAERSLGTETTLRRPQLVAPSEAPPSQGPVTVGAGVTLVPARLASGQVALVLPPGTALSSLDAQQVSAPPASSAQSPNASHSSSFSVPPPKSGETMFSSTPHGGPRLVALSSRPHEGFLYSVSENPSAPYAEFKVSSSHAETVTPSTLPPPPPLVPLSHQDDSPPPPNAPMRVDPQHNFSTQEHETSSAPCSRVISIAPLSDSTPSASPSTFKVLSLKEKNQEMSPYTPQYPSPPAVTPVFRPTPTFPEGVGAPSTLLSQDQETTATYELRPDAHRAFVGVVSSSTSHSPLGLATQSATPSVPTSSIQQTPSPSPVSAPGIPVASCGPSTLLQLVPHTVPSNSTTPPAPPGQSTSSTSITTWSVTTVLPSSSSSSSSSSPLSPPSPASPTKYFVNTSSEPSPPNVTESSPTPVSPNTPGTSSASAHPPSDAVPVPISATPPQEPLNLVTTQPRGAPCGSRPFSLKMGVMPTWRRSLPYDPPNGGRSSQPWRPW